MLALPVVFFYFLFQFISVESVSRLVMNSNGYYVIAAYLAFLITYLAKSARLRKFATTTCQLSSATFVSTLHGCAAMLLPGMLGEASLPFLARRFMNMPISHGIVALMITRLGDLIMVLMLLGVVSTLVMPRVDPLWANVSIGLVIGGAMVLLVRGDFVVKVLLYILDAILSNRMKKIDQMYTLLSNAQSFWREHAGFEFHRSLAMWSIMICILSVSFFHFAFAAVGIQLTLQQAMLMTVTYALSSLIPVSTVGGVGIKETAIAGALFVIGLNWEEALATAVAMRLLTLPSHFACIAIAGLWYGAESLNKVNRLGS